MQLVKILNAGIMILKKNLMEYGILHLITVAPPTATPPSGIRCWKKQPNFKKMLKSGYAQQNQRDAEDKIPVILFMKQRGVQFMGL